MRNLWKILVGAVRMFVVQAALDDLISPNVSEGERCAGSAGGSGQTPQRWKEGDEVEAWGLHKQREATGTWGTCCCALLLEMKTMGGKTVT